LDPAEAKRESNLFKMTISTFSWFIQLINNFDDEANGDIDVRIFAIVV